MGGMISGILGGGNSGAQEAQQKELAAARQAMQAYRPEAMQARMNLFNNASTAYQGANNALETMYGGAPKAGVGGRIPGLSEAPKTVMGHEAPKALLPNQQHSRVGGWEDPAMTLLDPAGIFRRFL